MVRLVLLACAILLVATPAVHARRSPARAGVTGAGVADHRPRVGISACLLGWMVRYDARPKGQPRLIEQLSRHVKLVPFCPEVAAGLTVPRSPIDIHVRNGKQRVIEQATGDDITPLIRRTNRTILSNMERQGIVGCVMKSKSPSCGIRTTKIFKGGEVSSTTGSGTLAFELLKRDGFPLVDEQALQQPGGVERFVRQVQSYASKHPVRASGATPEPHPLAEARQIIGEVRLSRGFARELAGLLDRTQRRVLTAEPSASSPVQPTSSAPGVRIIDRQQQPGRSTRSRLLLYAAHPRSWELMLQQDTTTVRGQPVRYLARGLKKLAGGKTLEVVDRIDDARGGGARGAYVVRDPQGKVIQRGRTSQLYRQAWESSERSFERGAACAADRKLRATFGMPSAQLVSLMDDLVR